MNPFDYSKAFTDFWTAQGQALAKAQEQAAKALSGGVQAMASGMLPAMPTDLSADAGEFARVSQSMTELWSAATAMSGTLTAKLPAFGGDATVEATFSKMLDPRSWMGGAGEMDDVLGRMAEGPRFADLWDMERRYARVLQAWTTVRRRGIEHNAVVLGAWLEAGRRFAEQLSGKTDAQTPDAKAALALWTETANRQLLVMQRSEPFLQTQTAMIRASTALRMAQQELVEHFGEQYGFPTRTELDDVHRTVTALRREMRIMKRAQRTSPPTLSAKKQQPPPPARRVAAAQKGTH